MIGGWRQDGGEVKLTRHQAAEQRRLGCGLADSDGWHNSKPASRQAMYACRRWRGRSEVEAAAAAQGWIMDGNGSAVRRCGCVVVFVCGRENQFMSRSRWMGDGLFVARWNKVEAPASQFSPI